MMYDSILARSFSKHEQKKLRYGALLASLLIAFSFCFVFKPFLADLPALKLRLSMGVGLRMLMLDENSSSQKIYKEATINSKSHHDHDHDHTSLKNTSNTLQVVDDINISHKIVDNSSTFHQLIVKNTTNSHQLVIKEFVAKKVKPICNIMKRTDFCEIDDEDIRIDGSSATVFIASSSPQDISAENQSWTIRPYARKGDQAAMNRVREWSVKSVNDPKKFPQCTQNHSIPVVLFSNGGYAGNHFHDFTDIVIPLFLTSRQFNGEVQFLITNKQSWWIKKFRKVVKNLSKYDPVDIDKEKGVHCFTSGIIGLKRHDKELNIDPSLSSYSMKDFRQFLRSSYSLKKDTAIKIRDSEKKRPPRLLIITRKRSRTFTNTAKIVLMARKMGFKVVVAEADMNVSKFAEIVNSCDVLLGVHGAGLTNIVFMPENAVFIQVVPFGGVEWLAKTDFEEPSKDMNLRYLEYKIKMEESSLIQQYPVDHQVLRDPASIGKQGWYAFRSVYMDKQNVELHLNTFRPTFLKALELLHQ
ncbi:hypothetical protein Q3G72_033683 [Acer saccharum]|nr:hypothetical protein Q3G72_033683 [Acer saccharum]